MAVAVAMAVFPTAVSGLHPKLVLMSDGRIVPQDGATVPAKSTNDPDAAPNWASARFYAFGNNGPTPTVGIAAGEIAQDIVLTNTDPSDPKGYVLDAWGRLHPFGTGTAVMTPTQTWGPPIGGSYGNDEARALSIKADGLGGYVLRKNGKLYRCGNVTVPMAVQPDYGPYDYARDVVLQYVSPTVIHGFVMGASGELTHVATGGGDAFLTTPKGNVYYGGYAIMQALVFNFATHVGYAMDGFGTPYIAGGASNYPPNSSAPRLTGGPYYPANVFVDFAWPDVSSPVFVSLTNQGLPTEWDQFVKPTVTISTPATTLSNTSRPTVLFTYGPSGGTPPVAALSSVTIFLYPEAATQASGFKAGQGLGAVTGYSHVKSGITGVDGGDTYSATFGTDLTDLTDYVLYIKATSLDGENSGWVSRNVHTNFSEPATPSLVATAQPNDPLGVRVRLVASGGLSGGQVYEYVFSDDGGSTWFDVFGAAATTATTVYDYEAPFLRNRRYKVYRITQSPYLASLPSTVQIINLALPTAGAVWRFVPLDGGTPVELDAAEWSKRLRHPLEVVDPAGETEGVVLSGGFKGITGTLAVHCWDKTSHDNLVALLEEPQVLLLQSPMSEQWYVVVGEAEFQLQHLGAVAGEPYPIRFAYDVTLPVTQVKRPIVV